MKIEFVSELNGDEEIKRIVVDGVKDNESELSSYGSLYVKSEETFLKLTKASFKELQNSLDLIDYSFDTEWSEYPINITISFPNLEGDPKSIWINPYIDYLKWNKPYALSEFIAKHKEIAREMNDIRFVEFEDVRNEISGQFFTLEIIIEDVAKPICKYIDLAVERLKEAHSLSLEILRDEHTSEEISVLYQFPPEIRTACNQYLMYFAQFLEDLGISVETSLKEQANKVLFTVTPKDKKQALDVIYKALAIYIEASDGGINKNFAEGDLAVMQWKANIFHLKSQLELSKAMLQAKDETIEALKIANYQLKTFVPNIQLNENTEAKDEKILGGLATVNTIALKGVTINLPEILRRLKRRFR